MSDNSKKISVYLSIAGAIMLIIIAPYVKNIISESPLAQEIRIVKDTLNDVNKDLTKLQTIQTQNCEALKGKLDQKDLKRIEEMIARQEDATNKLDNISRELIIGLAKIQTILERMK